MAKLRPVPTIAKPAPPPKVSLDSPEFEAFVSGGRAPGVPEQVKSPPPPAAKPAAPASPPADSPAPSAAIPAAAPAPQARRPDKGRTTVIKLPNRHAVMLDAIAAERAGFRSTIALAILDEELRRLADAHRSGRRPPLPPVEKIGDDRRSLSLTLPAEVAAALDDIAALRGAVKHQVLLRVLLPGIERVHASEIDDAVR